MNKIESLEEFIKSKIEFKRQKYEALHFSCGTNAKNHYWQLEGYRFESFHPFMPIFLSSNFKENYLYQDFLLCIDNPHDLYFLLQSYDSTTFGPLMLINRSIAPIVPQHWLEKVIYFDISLKDKSIFNKDRENLLIHGLVNATSMKEVPALDNIFDNKYAKQTCYMQLGWDRFSSDHHFSFMPKFIESFSRKGIDYKNLKKIHKLSNLSSYDFFDFNPGLLTTTYNYIGDKLLSLGARPKQIFKRSEKLSPKLSCDLSFYHSIDFFNGDDIDSSDYLDQIDELRLYSESEEDFSRCLADFCKEKFNPVYYC